ncbi:hypothetical protein BDW59DRAFT_155613, partial [Aspergillus cavernicola]
YYSAEEKKRKYADQYWQEWQLAAAAKQDAQFTNHHLSSANSLPPAVGLRPEQELVMIFNKLDELLPPDDPVLPSDYIASEATRIPDLALVEDVDSASDSLGLLPDNSEQINTGAGALSSSDPPDKSKVTSHLVNTLNIEVSVPNPTHELGKRLTDQEPFPDVLGQNRLPKLARKMEVYNRILSDSGSTELIHVCLQAESEQQPPSSVIFDIDSIISLHLSPIPVSYFDHHGHAHTVRRPVHQVPHYTFGRVIDQVLLPAIYQHHPSSLTQHYPSSYNHSWSNATARGVEMCSQKVDSTAREQALFYFLQPDLLHEIWGSILETIQKPGLHQFQGIRILLQAKNLKTLTKDHSWQAMTDRFEEYWHHAIVEDYTTAEFYFDIAKEVCPSGTSRVAVQHDHAEALPEQPQGSQPRTLLWKRQFYSSAKEIFAAGNIYPFTNTAIESLALDPKLRKTWQLVGKGLSHDPVALICAYLYTKQRCHHALQGSSQKSFGTREEHQVSKALLEQIHTEFQRCQINQTNLNPVLDNNPPYYCYPTPTIVNWLCWNINKFCAGFEMVYSLNNHHFVTWEHTCFSYSTGLIQRVGGCWHDIKYQSDTNQPNRLQQWEGLGFQTTMKQFGYAWFLNKVDWATLTFYQLFMQHMMFNSPSMQAAYHAHYPQVCDISIPPCLDLLEDFLRQLCLCAFQKDALAGEVPLCWPWVEESLREWARPPQLVGGNWLKVDKLYHMLYQQSFEIITQIRRKNQAWQWKQEVKASLARSHWLLPYPHQAGFMQ